MRSILARLSIGQNPGYINSIETGKSKPSMDAFFFICEYLRITPMEFFDPGSPDPEKLGAILQDLKKLNDEQLETIAALVKGLVKKA